MGRDKEIVIYEGLAHPVLCNKIRYYKDSYFTKRLLDKVEVKPLELHGDKRMKGRTATLVAASTLALLSACSSPQVQPAEPAPDPDSYFKSEAAEAADQAEAAADAQEAADRAAHPESYTPLPPGPAAGFPPAPTMPPMSASAFRSDILRLLESIQSIGDTQRPNVEAVMRAKMGNPGTDTYFLYYGSVHEGWDYGVDVYPDRANLTAEITFHLYFRGRTTERTLPHCTFDRDEFLAELKAAGWTIDERAAAERTGRRYMTYGKDLPARGIAIGGRLYFQVPGGGDSSQNPCVTMVTINAGHIGNEP